MMYKILSKINSPDDLKGLGINEINILAKEIRHFLINTISKTGGHIGSNLGVVELTLALHTVFNTRKDKIIWDVGHQTYVHKILTGRKDLFFNLRQHGGISGFPKTCESEHDHFNTGHSSTSISAALGMVYARDLKKEKNSILAVIGDGALTGGMAFEALNHAGQSKKNFIVILNDNEMSISRNVGGVSTYLNNIRTNRMYYKVRDDFENLINNIPAIGKTVMKTAEKAKDSIKYFFVPGILFEELGFKYIGPIDGHNYSDLCRVLDRCKKMSGPILLHVMTKKGKGYAPAEQFPSKFHGIGPFDISTGQTTSANKPISYSDIAGNSLVKHAKNDERIVAITAAMPSGTGLNTFALEYPERFFDVGIAEQHAITFSAGLASMGYKPFFLVYSTFLQRGYDQIIHDVCLQNLPVTLLIDRAGLVGNDGETHHGSLDISFLSTVPNLTIMSPKDGIELEYMIEYAVNQDKPIAIRYPRGSALTINSSNKNDISTGRGEVIYKEGDDILIIAVGHMNSIALEVCERLYNKNNIKSTLINPRFIKPMDKDLILEYVESHKIIYVIEDNTKIGGFGNQVQMLLNENQILKEVKILALPDKFIEHGDTNILYNIYGLSVDSIYDKINEDYKKDN